MSSQAVAWAIVMQAGGPSAKAVLMSIANYANAYGECWQDQKTLAEGAELQVRQFRNILKSLVERGLVEQVRRGGQGRGRLSDVLRLRMCELPAILTAKRREEGEEIDASEQPATGQYDRQQPAMQSNRQRLPLAQQPAKIAERATGNLRGGNRQIVAATVESHIPTVSKETDSPARRFLASMRDHMSPTGRQRTKPALCDKALPPLIAKHGFDKLLTAAKAFYSTPQARKDGGEFQPGLQVIANDGRLEALVAAPVDPAEIARRHRLFEFDGTWMPEWGPFPAGKQGSEA